MGFAVSLLFKVMQPFSDSVKECVVVITAGPAKEEVASATWSRSTTAVGEQELEKTGLLVWLLVRDENLPKIQWLRGCEGEGLEGLTTV